MGSCVSVHKDPNSAMRIHFSMGSKAKKVFAPSPSPDEKTSKGVEPISAFGFKSPDFGSKDETFFDSRAWLDSDCEDDFYSVNGDFTPSRGSTPIHPVSILNKPLIIDGLFDTKSEPSPRKKLAALLQETSLEEKSLNTQNVPNETLEFKKPTNPTQPLKFSNGTPHWSDTNSINNGTPDKEFGDAKHKKERVSKVAQCCLPSLGRSRSPDEKASQMSPG
ncbi:Uncharacterized protein QJS10_CPA16g00988 [Acorus calamus]|uniref:Uncharacterized protein n=1 Tax=Acorus calamus TaxID=4465 RepID=A0AAV9D059_ACOCL|nr:Uncharacterized protein QJS10_CPA16g00988 [Acorus calamus]